jgi:ERCC4-type nuclease
MTRREKESKTENTSESTERENLSEFSDEHDHINKIEEIPCIIPKKADILREAGYNSIGDLIKSNKKELSEIENIGYGLAARIDTHTSTLQTHHSEYAKSNEENPSSATPNNQSSEYAKSDEENSSSDTPDNKITYKNNDLPDKIKNISGIDELVAEALREINNDSVEDIIMMSHTELVEIDGVDDARATHINSDIMDYLEEGNKPENVVQTSNKKEEQSPDREPISTTLQAAERSFKEGIARYITGSQTVARIRFRQARDAFEEADQVITNNDTRILAQPIEITFEQQAILPSKALEDFALVEESTIETLASVGIESIADLETDSNEIRPDLVTDLQDRGEITAEEADLLVILSWWYEGDSRAFGSEAELSRRYEQADYGFDQCT